MIVGTKPATVGSGRGIPLPRRSLFRRSCFSAWQLRRPFDRGKDGADVGATIASGRRRTRRRRLQRGFLPSTDSIAGPGFSSSKTATTKRPVRHARVCRGWFGFGIAPVRPDLTYGHALRGNIGAFPVPIPKQEVFGLFVRRLRRVDPGVNEDAMSVNVHRRQVLDPIWMVGWHFVTVGF